MQSDATEDIECLASGEPVITSGSIQCLYSVAKGTDGLDPDTNTPQGHLDAGKFLTVPFLKRESCFTNTWIRGIDFIRYG